MPSWRADRMPYTGSGWSAVSDGSHATRRAARAAIARRRPDETGPRRAARAAAHRGRGRRGRARPAPRRARSGPLLRQGQAGRAEAAAKEADANLIAVDDELLPRQERNLEEALGVPVDRPHGDHPRHLRRPRALGRGQAAGRAGPARVQPRAHARAVDAPRAARRRPHGRRHRHEGPGRVADRDRPPARARPDRRAASGRLQRDEGHARDDARRARARGPADASRWPATRTPASRRC